MKIKQHFQIGIRNLVIGCMAMILACGCATLNDPNLTPEQKAQIVLDEDGPIIKAGVSLVVSAVIQFSEQNPDKRAEIKEELNRVSTQVAKLSEGDLSPAGLVASLKVKEDYIARILQAIVPLYSAGYQRLKNIGEGRLAVEYLNLIAEGIRDATQA